MDSSAGDLIELHGSAEFRSLDVTAQLQQHLTGGVGCSASIATLGGPPSSADDSEQDSETLSVGGHTTTSPGAASSAASDSPTPTNSVQDRSWAVSGHHWQGGLVSEEQRQLLGTEEESSDRHSSEEDTEVSSEVWTITAEQRDYYTGQFRALQPDLNALLPGAIARKFFEMSRLPVHELRKIWTLADVTKDGALSLDEFSIAMHLVVLRRNHIELPEMLPAVLMPGQQTPLDSVTPETEPILSPQTKENAREWTKFADSPTGGGGHGGSGSLSSPGPKPVNFDFQRGAVERDPKILHPVALRLTPEVSNNNNDNKDLMNDSITCELHAVEHSSDTASPKLGGGGDYLPPTHQHQFQHISSANNGGPRVIQRPQARKLHFPGAIPPPPAPTVITAVTTNQVDGDAGPISLPAFPPPKKEKPPPPPPRPFKTHGRSSSLDLNRLNKTLAAPAPPTVPPRVSPNIQETGQTSTTATKKLVNQRSEGGCGMPDTSAGAAGHRGVGGEEFANFEQYENVPDDEGIFPGERYEAQRKKLFAQFSIQDDGTGMQHHNQFSSTVLGGSDASSAVAAGSSGPPRKHGAFEIYRKPTPKSSRSSPTPEDVAKYELFVKLQEQNTVLLRLCQELSQELADVREQKLALRVRLEKMRASKQHAAPSSSKLPPP